jgi:hypothetical protein
VLISRKYPHGEFPAPYRLLSDDINYPRLPPRVRQEARLAAEFISLRSDVDSLRVYPPQFLGGWPGFERQEGACPWHWPPQLLTLRGEAVHRAIHPLLLRLLQYRCDRVVNNPVTNSEDPGLKSRPGDRLLLGFSWCYSFLQAAAQIVSRISEGRFIQLPLHFIALSFGSV